MADYHGHVEPGGPAGSRMIEAAGTRVEVRKFSVGPMDNNVYLLRDLGSGEGVLIDAANEARRIIDELGDVQLVAIVTTHGHPDHWQALDEVADETGAPVLLHPGDSDMVPRSPDHPLEDGATITFGDSRLEAIHTPGHTPGSTCLLLRSAAGDHLFTGDTLFPGGPGNTFGNADAFAQIMTSLRQRLFVLDDSTWVYPGHGDDTTLGAERPALDEWQARGW